MTSIDDFIIKETSIGSAALSRSRVNGDGRHIRGFEEDNASPTFIIEAGFVSHNPSNASSSPLFSLTKVQYELRAAVVGLAVSNNVLIMALDSNRLLRFDLDNPTEVDDIELPRKPGEVRIHKIFFDKTGQHVIITTLEGENFYYYAKWKKAKLLAKYKGLVIESIAWNPTTSSSSTATKEFLIGTSSGTIYEGQLEPTSEYFRKEERYLKEVYRLNDDSAKITGLRFEAFPTNPKKQVVIMTTNTRLYQFIGQVAKTNPSDTNATFDPLFANYKNNPNFQELPGTLDHSELHFLTPFNSVPSSFAWLTEPGIYYGNFVFGSQDVGDSIIDNAQLFPYPSQHDDIPEVPISISISPFHFILLYSNRVTAINQLTKEVVYNEMLPLKAGENVLSLTQDISKRTFWIATDQSIFELDVSGEDRDMWKLYLDRSMFDTALQHAKTSLQKDKILRTQGDYYFNSGRYVLSASYYARSSAAFEEVALKFVDKNERDALRQYLLEILERLGKRDKIQRTMLATWLVEIYLSRLNTLEDLIAARKGVEDISNYEAEQKVLEDEFKGFLSTYKSNLDAKTTYSLISSHGRPNELLHYAEAIGDEEKVISHWIQQQDWLNALSALNKQKSILLFQKYAAVLMDNAPQETVNVLMRHTDLNPRDLIPGLLKYTQSRISMTSGVNQAIRYLQFVIQQLKSTDSAIHNFLITLFATQKSKDESELLQYLASQSREPSYNLDYALRICSQNKRMQSCVHIYGVMGLHESAVDLALKFKDIELARIYADKPEDERLRKTLWLKIAKHVICEEKDIKKAMEFHQQSGVLKIDDILPFFPDFMFIDDFKDELCSALEGYNDHIDALKIEMNQASKSAESIKDDLKELRTRHVTVDSEQKCSICEMLLLTRQFYIFPCQHGFHGDCLVDQASRLMKISEREKLNELQEQIIKEMSTKRSGTVIIPNGSEIGSRIGSGSKGLSIGTQGGLGFDRLKGLITSDSGSNVVTEHIGWSKIERLKEELDELIASECYLCGEIMLLTIDQPFISEEDKEEMESWVI